MIIIRTPYRISFFGGGTDYPKWYNKFSGKTISTSINFYSFLTLSKLEKYFNYNYRIRYYYREEAKRISGIKHPTIRNVLQFKKFKSNLSLYHYGDLPAKTGIGSSSSFTVGLIHGVNILQKKKIIKKSIYKDAIFTEQKLNKESVGSQDQVISTVGGFKSIRYSKKKIIVRDLKKYQKNILKIQNSCILVYSGRQRSSYKIVKKNILMINKKKKYYSKILNIANSAEKLIKSQNFKIEKFAELLNKSWELKTKTSKNITNSKINNIIDLSLKNGALGGKLLGAGSSGFILLIAKKNVHKKLKKVLKNYVIIKPKFDNEGSKIIYENNL